MSHLATIFTLGLALAAGAPLQPQVNKPQPVSPSAADTLQAQLEALSPDDPAAYYRLGEVVAAEAQDQQSLLLAKRLYVLTIVLASQSPGQETTAASACVALADVTRADADREALWSLARTLDARYGVRDWSRSTDIAVTDDIAFATATALGQIRAGWGSLVHDDLKRPETRRLIDRYASLITGTPNQNILPELERQAEQWPCPECRNDRIVSTRVNGKIEQHLCYTCQGNPGPSLTTQQLIGQLRFESYLLGGRPRSWGAQVAADLGEPLREADLVELPIRFDVDPTRTLYRNGEWVAPDSDASDADDQTPSLEQPASTNEPLP